MATGACVLETVAGFSGAAVVGLLVVVVGLVAAGGGLLVALEGGAGTSSAGGETAVEANAARYGSLRLVLNRCFRFSLCCHLHQTPTLHTAQHVRRQDHVVGTDAGEPGGALVDLRSRQAEELTR